MTNEQKQGTSPALNIIEEIFWFVLKYTFIGLVLLSCLGNVWEVRGIMMLVDVVISATIIWWLLMIFVFQVFLKQRYEWFGKYIAVFFSVTKTSTILVEDYFEPNILSTFVTLGYSALIGIIACLLFALFLPFLRIFKLP